MPVPTYRYFVRNSRDTSSGDWTLLSGGTAPLQPRFSWLRDDGTIDLLWIRAESILGPPFFTFREQGFDPVGNGTWISTYHAGSQPCD